MEGLRLSGQNVPVNECQAMAWASFTKTRHFEHALYRGGKFLSFLAEVQIGNVPLYSSVQQNVGIVLGTHPCWDQQRLFLWQ